MAMTMLSYIVMLSVRLASLNEQLAGLERVVPVDDPHNIELDLKLRTHFISLENADGRDPSLLPPTPPPPPTDHQRRTPLPLFQLLLVHTTR